MKVVLSFFKLIRWPNLFFIFLAQLLFEFCIYNPIFKVANSKLDHSFVLMLMASILIAAAGYIINDYFDINIDQVNKPKKVVVSLIISRRWVIFWHSAFSLTGIYLTSIALPFHEFWHIHLANLLSILLLWFYSTHFKKQLLVGNILIAFLTAWSIGVVYFSKFPIQELFYPSLAVGITLRLFKLMVLYTSFAFVLTLIREALKDVEDMEGDAKFGCKTMPIVWGIKPTKVYIGVWLFVSIAILSIIQLYLVPFGWWYSIGYSVIFIITPLLVVLLKLANAHSSKEFHVLSNWIKVAMLAGILSMVFFYFIY